MSKASLNVYCELLKDSLAEEVDEDILFRKLLCTIVHLAVAAEQLGMHDVTQLLEDLYQKAAKHSESVLSVN